MKTGTQQQTKHTLGPWRLGVRKPSSDKFIYGLGGAEVADCDRLTNFADVNLANARLIAAAPDLLAALRDAEEASGEALSIAEAGDIKEATDRLVRIQDDLRAAIAKAEGRA